MNSTVPSGQAAISWGAAWMHLKVGRAGYYANACVRRKNDSGNFTMQSRGSMDTTRQGSTATFGNPADKARHLQTGKWVWGCLVSSILEILFMSNIHITYPACYSCAYFQYQVCISHCASNLLAFSPGMRCHYGPFPHGQLFYPHLFQFRYYGHIYDRSAASYGTYDQKTNR